MTRDIDNLLAEIGEMVSETRGRMIQYGVLGEVTIDKHGRIVGTRSVRQPIGVFPAFCL